MEEGVVMMIGLGWERVLQTLELLAKQRCSDEQALRSLLIIGC